MRVFPSDAYRSLGFESVRNKILSYLNSEVSRTYFKDLPPSSEKTQISSRLSAAEELMKMLQVGSPPDIFDPYDISSAVRSARPEKSKLGPEDILPIGSILRKSRIGQKFLSERGMDYPTLAASIILSRQEDLEKQIDDSIEKDGRIKDTASPELRRIRKSIAKLGAQLRQVAQKELSKAIQRGVSADDQLVMRYGKLVLPVTAEAKRKINGVVVDTSSTGQTVYIEPYACTELSNEIRILENEELREIDKILLRLTSQIRHNAGTLLSNLESLARLDCLRAIAKLAVEMEAIVPSINSEGDISIKGGRNPELLLTHSQEDFKVVPLDFEMNSEVSICIISGPNAGGKSVALKTVGLFTIMASYGIPLPCRPGTSISIFSSLFSSIGDEQSIEDDLSTFSSSLKRLNQVSENGDTNTLVLIDEMGNGTDPKLGAAISQAFLEDFYSKGFKVLATTHHVQLKTFASDSDGIENASMEFDQEALEPTYRFRKGIPGSSYTFEIAARMGVNSSVINRASELIDEKELGLDELLASLETKEKKHFELSRELELKESQLKKARKNFEEERNNLLGKEDAIRLKATMEAESILLNANARIERVVQEIVNSKGDKQKIKTSREKLEKIKLKVTNKKEKIELAMGIRDEVDKKPKISRKIADGDMVRIIDSSAKGQVVSMDSKKAVIAIGDMRSTVAINRLELIQKETKSKKRRKSFVKAMPMTDASMSIDVRGKRVHECIPDVIQFVDRSIMANLETVHILHGTGTGALRKAIKLELEKHPGVQNIDEADLDQGGPGVSVVALK